MPAVFDLNHLELPIEQSLSFETVIANFGDGFEQRANKNLAYTRADGKGGVTSYKGRNRFRILWNFAEHENQSATKAANVIWDFYQDTLGGLTPFYVYHSAENPAGDPTGVDTTGRYLVRFENNTLARTNFAADLFRGELMLIEVRA